MQALRAQKSRVKVLYSQILDLPSVSNYTRTANRPGGPVSEAFHNGTILCRLYGTATKASIPFTTPQNLGGELSRTRLRVLFRQLGTRALEQAKAGAEVAALVPKGLGSVLSQETRHQGQVWGLRIQCHKIANREAKIQSISRKSARSGNMTEQILPLTQVLALSF